MRKLYCNELRVEIGIYTDIMGAVGLEPGEVAISFLNWLHCCYTSSVTYTSM